MRPASITDTTRLTRSRAISDCQVTSTKWQPYECIENFGLGLPKVDSLLPLPVAWRRLARRRRSAKGTARSGPSALTNTLPASNARSSDLRRSKGVPGVEVAIFSSDSIALSAAAHTAGITELVAIEPPEIGPGGREVSPSATSILSSGTPVFWDAICARFV